MAKYKVKMGQEVKIKCHIAIHTATAAAAAAGAIPIPMSDAVPITTAQIAMVVAIGKAFDVSISETVARSLIGITLTQQAGRALVSNILKAVPGAGTVVGGVIGATTAAGLTEALGWLIANDFQRIKNNEEPENLIGVAADLKEAFAGLKIKK